MSTENQACLVFSRFLQEKQKGDEVVIFNNLRPNSPLGVDFVVWRDAKDNPQKYEYSKLFEDLRERTLLIPSPLMDKEKLDEAKETFNQKLVKHPTTLYLVLTENCNMRCTYCPFSQPRNLSQETPKSMTLEIAQRGIDLWSQAISQDSESEQPHFIIFYGGEPLLNPNTLTGALEYIDTLHSASRLPQNTRLLLDTNGTLLSNSLASLLKIYSVEVTVALDDFSKLNDTYRKDMRNKGTYKTVLITLQKLQRAGITTYLSTSLTPYNLDRLSDIARYLREYNIRGIGVNILRGKIASEIGTDNCSNPETFQKDSIDALIDLFWLLQETGGIEFQTGRRFIAFTSGNFHLTNCGGYGEHLVIHPNGDIGNCPWSSAYNIGNVMVVANPDKIQKLSFFNSYRHKLPLYDDYCLECAAISICGGRCIWADDQVNGTSNSFCLLSQQMMDNLVWKYRNH